MAILQSCCWWRSVRRGTYASAVYTLIYFGCTCIIVASFLHEERRYLYGEVDKPMGESFLEREEISPTTVIFNILLLGCAILGVFASTLVLVALKCDKRELLLPWIAVMVTNVLVECAHFLYLVYCESLQFEPLTATLFTIDFFIMCLNLYCLLCVVSQYQEYQVGRGGARHDISQAGTTIQYVPPTATNMQCAINNAYDSGGSGGGGSGNNGDGCCGGAGVVMTPLCSGGGAPNGNPVQHPRSSSVLAAGARIVSASSPHRHYCTIIPEESNGNSFSISPTHKTQFARRNSSKHAKKHVQFPDQPAKCCTPENASIVYPTAVVNQHCSLPTTTDVLRDAASTVEHANEWHELQIEPPCDDII